MPRLSVHCVVTHHDGSTQQSRRDTWIEAYDFRQLALAATAQLRLPPEHCEYKLFAPDVGKAFVGVLLEVVHMPASGPGLSALVGPMGGPTIPASLADEQQTYSLDELIAHTGFDADAEHRGILPVTVVYTGLLGNGACSPARDPGESSADYRIRCAYAERLRLERGRYEGFHALRYDVPVVNWRAEDLEVLLGRAHALLPAHEPPWRESGTITQEPFAPGATPAGTIGCTLEVQRGDFVAHLGLPAFPVSALADWLACRRCEINLCHPMGKLQIPADAEQVEEERELAATR